MDQARELAVRRRPQCEALYGARAVACREEHLLAGKNELNRALYLSRRDRREGDMRPGPQACAEGTADERADHLHVLGGNAEDCRDLRLLIDDELALAPQR